MALCAHQLEQKIELLSGSVTAFSQRQNQMLFRVHPIPRRQMTLSFREV